MSTMTLDLPAECAAPRDLAVRMREWNDLDPEQQANCDPPDLILPDAPAFIPWDDDDAAQFARRAAALKHEADDLRANAKAMIEDLESRLEWLLQAEDQRLREWIGRKGAKSRRTLYGLLGTRTSGGGLKVDNERDAFDTACLLGAVVTTESIDLKRIPLNETVDTETGEGRPVPPPGFRWEAPKSKLYIQPQPRGKNGGDSDE